MEQVDRNLKAAGIDVELPVPIPLSGRFSKTVLVMTRLEGFKVRHPPAPAPGPSSLTLSFTTRALPPPVCMLVL